MIEYNITLHVTSDELKELTEHIKAEEVTPEIWFKRAICSFTNGMMYSGDNVWFHPQRRSVSDEL